MPLAVFRGEGHRRHSVPAALRTKSMRRDVMRVLWFTSVMPAAVSTHLWSTGSVGPASWVESLRLALAGRDDLDLAIASPCPTSFIPFSASDVSYYGMHVTEPDTRFGRAFSGWRESFVLPDMTQACEDVVRDFNPDIIHVHGTENPFGLIGPRSRAPVVISLQGLLTVYERFYFHGMRPREVADRALQRSFVLGDGAIHGYWRCVRMAVREREIMRINRSFMGRTEWDRAVLWAINPSATYHHCDEVLRPPFYDAAWQREATARDGLLHLQLAHVEGCGMSDRGPGAPSRCRICGRSPPHRGNPAGAPTSDFYRCARAQARRHGVHRLARAARRGATRDGTPRRYGLRLPVPHRQQPECPVRGAPRRGTDRSVLRRGGAKSHRRWTRWVALSRR